MLIIRFQYTHLIDNKRGNNQTKRLLSIIGVISLVATSTTSLVGCKTEDQLWLEKLKKKKKKTK
ncbi:lipoprotein [Spiroplasma poulsonii]|uniref:lipoprotein n=1 Tax=Spiroplasma poulsonii TaxID=2138 RepID=UPI00058A0C33|nr:lipoprotein [Spiroplasma poulsonii]PWF95149.1 hypothetical protein SMSE_05740 [Spiroplasma poulsonii]